MKFNTTPRKIDYSTNHNKSNENEISNQDQTNSQNNESINNSNPSSSIFKSISDLSTDWEPMITPRDEFSISKVNQMIGWTITIERIDERFLPYIDTTILYRNSGGIGTPYIPRTPSKNIFFEIIDLIGEDNIKKLNIHAGFFIFETVTFATFKTLDARLMIKLSDKLVFT